ncbi:CAP domain-containing protein [Spirosoma radiotolerans]|uniref:CAP domain-containing protein n=1 Tax=Spirosoma radiotolerans TaxID=1379870 RepID=UPI000696A514|nr:CAP domain-containing protein [Spirosoma radiotolerans]
MNLVENVAFIILSGWLMTGLGLKTSLLEENAPLKPLHHAVDVVLTADLPGEKEAILVATNQQRVRKGLPALTQDAKLMQAAQQYAELMAAKDQMSHTLNGLTLVDKAKRVGYSFRQLSENIALNTRLDGRFVVIDQWMESKGHRKNILTSGITDIGIGIAGPSKQNRYYYCQLFGAQL